MYLLDIVDTKIVIFIDDRTEMLRRGYSNLKQLIWTQQPGRCSDTERVYHTKIVLKNKKKYNIFFLFTKRFVSAGV